MNICFKGKAQRKQFLASNISSGCWKCNNSLLCNEELGRHLYTLHTIRIHTIIISDQGHIGTLFPYWCHAHSGQCQPLKIMYNPDVPTYEGHFMGPAPVKSLEGKLQRRQAICPSLREIFPRQTVSYWEEKAAKASNRKHMISSNILCQLSNNQAKDSC